MCIDEGMVPETMGTLLCLQKVLQTNAKKKQSFEQKMSEIMSINFFTSPFQPPKKVLTGPTGGLQKTPAYPPSHRRFRKAELQELNNGRLAMMGITGLIAQAGRWVGRSSLGWTSRWTLRNTQNAQKPF